MIIKKKNVWKIEKYGAEKLKQTIVQQTMFYNDFLSDFFLTCDVFVSLYPLGNKTLYFGFLFSILQFILWTGFSILFITFWLGAK